MLALIGFVFGWIVFDVHLIIVATITEASHWVCWLCDTAMYHVAGYTARKAAFSYSRINGVVHVGDAATDKIDLKMGQCASLALCHSSRH